MARLFTTERFVSDLSCVWSPKVASDIREAIDAVKAFPKMGSTEIPASIRAEFGPDVRKVVARPFDVFYTYDEEADAVIVMALVHSRRVH